MIAAASDSFLVAIATVGMHIIPRNGLFAWKKSIPLSVTFFTAVMEFLYVTIPSWLMELFYLMNPSLLMKFLLRLC